MSHDPEGLRPIGRFIAPLAAAARLARIARLHAERDRALARGDEQAAADLHARWAEHKAADSAGRA